MKHIIGIILLVFLITSCQKPDDLWEPSVLVKIDFQTVRAEEMLVYGIQVKKEFEEIGGIDIWEYESFSGDKSAYEVAKTKVLENLIRVKILAARARERKIELSQPEHEKVMAKAHQFFEAEIANKGTESTFSEELIQNIFLDFALGQKLKTEMLQSFEPTESMLEEKAAEEEALLRAERESLEKSYSRYLLQYAEIEPENEAQISAIKEAIYQNGVLTEELTRGILYQEVSYVAPEIEALFGEGILKVLEQEDLFLEDGGKFLWLHLKAVELTDSAEFEEKQKDLEEKRQILYQQAESQIKDESFEIIYQEWKKDANIQINQAEWEKFIVFDIH